MQTSLGACCLQWLLAGRGEVRVTAVHGKFNLCCYNLAEPERRHLNVSQSLNYLSLATAAPASYFRRSVPSSFGSASEATPTLFPIPFATTPEDA